MFASKICGNWVRIVAIALALAAVFGCGSSSHKRSGNSDDSGADAWIDAGNDSGSDAGSDAADATATDAATPDAADATTLDAALDATDAGDDACPSGTHA